LFFKELLIHVASACKTRRRIFQKARRKSGVCTEVNEHFEENSNAVLLVRSNGSLFPKKEGYVINT